jgi:hypothetical protein
MAFDSTVGHSSSGLALLATAGMPSLSRGILSVTATLRQLPPKYRRTAYRPPAALKQGLPDGSFGYIDLHRYCMVVGEEMEVVVASPLEADDAAARLAGAKRATM